MVREGCILNAYVINGKPMGQNQIECVPMNMGRLNYAGGDRMTPLHRKTR